MRVLLVGKYPPCQGGIAAKTYWMSRALAEAGLRFDVVTVVPERYSSRGLAGQARRQRLVALKPTQAPWFVPGADLWTERLVSAGLKLAASIRPDLVEVNYLAPFGLAGLVLAQSLAVPLLVRHAGSDIAKLLGWVPAARALTMVLEFATCVVTPETSPLCFESTAPHRPKVVRLPRYVPDPTAFTPIREKAPPASPLLLFAGKINYYWRFKALDSLLAALVLRPDWHLMMVANGTGKEQFMAEVERLELTTRVTWRDFVHPSEMPRLLAGAGAVWVVDRPGGPQDYSNLVAEVVAVGRPCLVSRASFDHPDATMFRRYPGLLVVNPEDPTSCALGLDSACALHMLEPPSEMQRAHSDYIQANRELYRTLLSPADQRRCS